MQKGILTGILLLLSSSCFSQPQTKLVWGTNLFSAGIRSFMFNPMPSTGLIDKNHNSVFFIPVHDSLRIENRWFLKSENINYVVAKFDSTGKLIWTTPVKGKYSKTGIYGSAILENGSVIFSSSGEDSVRIGNQYYSSPGLFRYIACLDDNGEIIRLIGDLSVTLCRSGFGKNSLLLAEIIPPDTLLPGNFKYEGSGTYLLRMDSDFNLIGSIKISGGVSSSFEDIAIDNRFRIYISAISNKVFVLEFQDTVYPYSYQNSTAFSVSDLHLFCLDTQGNKLWHLRIDSCSDGGINGLRNVAPLSNDRLVYIPYYSRSVNILGNSVFVKFRGGRYPYLIFLNSKTGAVIRSIYSDSVDGGETDHTYAISDIYDYNSVFIRTLSKTGYHKWKGLPDSVKNFYGRMMMVADTGMNFMSFCTPVEAPRNNDFHPFVYSQMTALKPADVQYNYAGHTFKNQGGYDYFVGLCGPPSMQSYNGIVSARGWNFTIFPNPGSGLLNISGEIPRSTACYVIDPVGRIFRSMEINENSSQIDIQDLNSGLYFIVFVNPGRPNYTYRYIKQQ